MSADQTASVSVRCHREHVTRLNTYTHEDGQRCHRVLNQDLWYEEADDSEARSDEVDEREREHAHNVDRARSEAHGALDAVQSYLARFDRQVTDLGEQHLFDVDLNDRVVSAARAQIDVALAALRSAVPTPDF